MVIFLHGQCTSDSDVYLRWTQLPAALARSGYVVVVPKAPNINRPFDQVNLDHMEAVLNWMHSGWKYGGHLLRSPGPAIVGHSYGAVMGVKLAPRVGASAYVSLSGTWLDWNEEEFKILADHNVPSLFAWGGGNADARAHLDDPHIVPTLWSRIKSIKHKLVFEEAKHWDYLPSGDKPCLDEEPKGKCSLVPSLAADYAALFLSRYVPPAGAGIDGLIPPSLTVPTVVRTPLQDLFWSGHLQGVKSLPKAGEECHVTHEFENVPPYLFDRSAQYVTPDAASPPTAVVIPGLGVYNIAYRDTSGHLHELWRDGWWNTGTTDLTAYANAPKATGNPFAYVDTRRNTEILLYRDSSGTVRSLYWSTGAVGHDNLSGTAGSPAAAGDPVGYYDAAKDLHHIIYRSSNNHLHELWCEGIQPIQYGGDLTALASAPPAVGQPSAIVDGSGNNLVIYRSADGHIRSLFWTTGGVTQEDLSGFAGTPPAVGDPVAYYTADNDTVQIVYRANDGHLWELYSQGNAPVAGWDIMADLNAPPADSTPAAFYSASTNTKHVIYRSAGFLQSYLHEIVWTPGGGIRAHVDISTAYGTPLAHVPDQAAAFTVASSNTQHVTYRGADNHIYEVILR